MDADTWEWVSQKTGRSLTLVDNCSNDKRWLPLQKTPKWQTSWVSAKSGIKNLKGMSYPHVLSWTWAMTYHISRGTLGTWNWLECLFTYLVFSHLIFWLAPNRVYWASWCPPHLHRDTNVDCILYTSILITKENCPKMHKWTYKTITRSIWMTSSCTLDCMVHTYMLKTWVP
jgi:hypothetical protein